MDEGAIATHVGFSTNLTVGWDAMVVIKNHPVSKLLGGGWQTLQTERTIKVDIRCCVVWLLCINAATIGLTIYDFSAKTQHEFYNVWGASIQPLLKSMWHGKPPFTGHKKFWNGFWHKLPRWWRQLRSFQDADIHILMYNWYIYI